MARKRMTSVSSATRQVTGQMSAGQGDIEDPDPEAAADVTRKKLRA
jgi:hypothetical protein